MRIKGKQSTCCKTCYDILWGEGFLPRRADKRSKMLFTNYIIASALKSFYLLLINYFKRGKYSTVAELELIESI
jgi:hypothetical protein